MKKFQFSLQNVLRLKESVEENEKMVLAELKEKQKQLIAQRRELEDEYLLAVRNKREALSGGTTPSKIRSLTIYAEEIQHRINAKNEEIHQVMKQIDHQVEVVKKASVEVKTLEKLKEKQFAEYKEQESKENELAINEFISNRAL